MDQVDVAIQYQNDPTPVAREAGSEEKPAGALSFPAGKHLERARDNSCTSMLAKNPHRRAFHTLSLSRRAQCSTP
jgi:hypothetical protein